MFQKGEWEIADTGPKRRKRRVHQTSVAVEKLTSRESAEIRSRQDALQTIFSGRLDIFYLPNLSLISEILEFFNSHICFLNIFLRNCRAFSLNPI